MRAVFFGHDGDTRWNQRAARVRAAAVHASSSSTSATATASSRLSPTSAPDLIVHCAAQPSHDLAARMPFEDFDVNAVGTLNLLEATRRHAPEAVFVFMSTNKVYGDAPNELPLKELETRWDYADEADDHGIAEACRIDRTLHSLFGASKVAADVMAQEYGRYFGMKIGVFRGGCLTGPQHSGVELHGFLSYLVKAAPDGQHLQRLRLQGEAGPRQHPLPRRAAARSTGSPRPRGRARSTTSAAGGRTAARSSRPPRSSRNSAAAGSRPNTSTPRELAIIFAIFPIPASFRPIFPAGGSPSPCASRRRNDCGVAMHVQGQGMSTQTLTEEQSDSLAHYARSVPWSCSPTSLPKGGAAAALSCAAC